MTIVGAADPLPVRYTLPVPSAQVKSAVLLAGLNAPGETVVIEAEATRDHTERMLAGFGAEIATEVTKEGRVITLVGRPELRPQTIAVPRDPSSAAFPVCAALITEGSDVLVPNIGLNPTRAGLYTTLREMGADLTYENEREEGGEPVADLRARFSPGHERDRGAAGTRRVDDRRIPDPVGRRGLCRGADRDARREGTARQGKRPDRGDGGRSARLRRDGGGRAGLVDRRGAGAGRCARRRDLLHPSRPPDRHVVPVPRPRVAKPVAVDDAGPIATSFPIFEPLMRELGAHLDRANRV
jgi:3-phosphoshikimate 1-carboxyvinyltransferase